MTCTLHTLTQALTGNLAEHNRGILIVMPKGTRGRGAVKRTLENAYHTLHHPDIRVMEREGDGQHKIETLRNLQSFLGSSSSGNAIKTLLILEACQMTPATMNALLKTLEEPTSRTRVVLTTDRPKALLPTIRSRCFTLIEPATNELLMEDTLERLEETDEKSDPKTLQSALTTAQNRPDIAADLLISKTLDFAKACQDWAKGQKAFPTLTYAGGKTPKPKASTLQTLLEQALLTRWQQGKPLSREQEQACWDTFVECGQDSLRKGLNLPARIARMTTLLKSL